MNIDDLKTYARGTVVERFNSEGVYVSHGEMCDTGGCSEAPYIVYRDSGGSYSRVHPKYINVPMHGEEPEKLFGRRCWSLQENGSHSDTKIRGDTLSPNERVDVVEFNHTDRLGTITGSTIRFGVNYTELSELQGRNLILLGLDEDE